MIVERFRLIFPIGLIVLVSMILLGSWPEHSINDRFYPLMQTIANAPFSEIGPSLTAAESYIQFQYRGLAPQPGEEAARPIADLYFRLGDALLSRPEAETLTHAQICYQKAIALYPSLRQGWPFFQLGHLNLRNPEPGSAEAAKRFFQQVSLYNSGILSLQAVYQIAKIDLQEDPSAIHAKSLYEYLRFAANDPLVDVKPFAAACWDQREEAQYIQALLALAQEDHSKAVQLFTNYQQLRPKDYSAAYYLERLSGEEPLSLNPPHGNLLISCFAPRAFQDGELLLVHNHNIRADFYVGQPDQHGLTITLDLENPFQHPVVLYVTVNEQVRSLVLNGSFSSPCSFSFESLRERNFVNLHVLMEEGETNAVNPVWIRVKSLIAHLLPSETHP